VTALTIDETTVVELRSRPVLGASVAIAALAPIMVLWRIAGVAALAVGEPAVVKADLHPIRCAQMAAAALAQVMVLRCIAAVTALTVSEFAVIEPNLRPTHRAQVAAAAFARIVILRRIAIVTALAVDQVRVVELNSRPVCRTQVATTALTRIVILRYVSSVAALAINRSSVIELDLNPVDRTSVTAATLPRIVLRGKFIAVTALAIGEIGVIELDLGPIGHAQVATAALASIVLRGYILGMAALAVVGCDVVKLHVSETNGGMAQLARRPHPSIVRILVASYTRSLGSLIDPLAVTALTLCRSVRAQQRKRMICECKLWKGDSTWRDRCTRCPRGTRPRGRLCGHSRVFEGGPQPTSGPHHRAQTQANNEKQDQKWTYPTRTLSFHTSLPRDWTGLPISVILFRLTGGMATSAVRDVLKTFLAVLALGLRRFVLVAAGTDVGEIAAWMTDLAGDVASCTAVIQRKRMIA
jgi:hypothetical protein